MRKLQEAKRDIVRHLDIAFREGTASPDLSDALVEADVAREVDVDLLDELFEQAMTRFDARPAQSDAWLGPRFHCALRLTRREAARRGIWRFLAADVAPDYVRWRWKGRDGEEAKPAGLDRFVGPDYKHALGRLWWMAEVFRDGPNGPAARALSNQDIINNLFRMDIAHHRPTAQASTDLLVPLEGKTLTGREGG